MRVLVFQHLAAEGPGRFVAHLAADGVEVETVRFWENAPVPALDDHDVLMVLGGDMDVWDVDVHPWLIEEKRAIRRWVRELDRPFLGICLGHQLLADALGGTCGPLKTAEVGIHEIRLDDKAKTEPLLTGLPSRFRALQWHAIRVAQAPEDADVLASSDECANQIMRIGTRAFGLQFHIEAEPRAVRDWSCIGDYRAVIERRLGPSGVAELEGEFAEREADFAATAATIYRNFMRIAAG